MRGYIITLATASVLAAFCDILIPVGWRKYIGVLTGAIMLIILISPLAKLHGENPETLVLPEADYIEFDINEEVAEQLKERVIGDIKLRLLEEFGTDTNPDVEIDISEGHINGVSTIYLDCDENSHISERLLQVYGCERVVFL